MNWLSWEVPKNSFSAATTGRMLIRDWGVIASTSWVVIRSRTTRSMRARPVRSWFWISSPTVRMRRLPKWSMSSALMSMVPWGASIWVRPSCSATMYLIAATTSSTVSVCWSKASVRPSFLLIL